MSLDHTWRLSYTLPRRTKEPWTLPSTQPVTTVVCGSISWSWSTRTLTGSVVISSTNPLIQRLVWKRLRMGRQSSRVVSQRSQTPSPPTWRTTSLTTRRDMSVPPWPRPPWVLCVRGIRGRPSSLLLSDKSSVGYVYIETTVPCSFSLGTIGLGGVFQHRSFRWPR